MATRSFRAVGSLVSNRRFRSRDLNPVEEPVQGAIIVDSAGHYYNSDFTIYCSQLAVYQRFYKL